MCFSWRPKLIDLECYFKTIKCPHLDENVQAVKVLYNIKISKSKHQITNKSQITIFNDQNSHRGCILETRKLVSTDNYDIWYECRRITCLEF